MNRVVYKGDELVTKARSTRFWSIAEETLSRFGENQGGMMAAALTLFLLLTIAPLVLIFLSVAGQVLSAHEVRETLIAALVTAVGTADDDLVRFIVEAVGGTGSRSVTAAAFLVALYGATGVFAGFRAALGHMWEAEPLLSGWRAFVRGRAVALVTLLLTGGSMALAVLVLAFGTVIVNIIIPEVWRTGLLAVLINDGMGLLLATVVFAIAYRVLPERRLPWRDLLVGAFVTAGLVTLGRVGLGIYFSFSRLATVYGAVGSFLIVLLWLYYSAQVTLIGAQFTYVWSIRDMLDEPDAAHRPLT